MPSIKVSDFKFNFFDAPTAVAGCGSIMKSSLSAIFFIISNLGVWFLGNLYEKNLEGLIKCYFLAIPFFKNTLFSTLIFSYTAIYFHKYSTVKVKD